MARNRKSAKTAGARFERSIADALAAALDDDRIEPASPHRSQGPRRYCRCAPARPERKTFPIGRGDIAGVRLHGQRVVIECKDVATLRLPEWTAEARIEAGNDDALVGLVVHKRRGVADPMRQWVTCTVADLVAILTGQRVEQ